MPPLADLVPVAALLGLLVTAYLHPTGRVEAAMGVLAVAVTALTGLLTWAGVRDVLGRLGPVVGFLVTILVVAEVCARAGLFAAAAARVGAWSRGRPVRLFTGVFVLAAAVTTALSLDATVVLLTPVVVSTGVALGLDDSPGSYACLRMANSASLLLPVANLTNLLLVPYLGLTFTGFAFRLAPVWAVVVLVEYVVLRLLFRRPLAVKPEMHDDPAARRVAVFPVVVVVLMLVGFAVASPYGVQPVWVCLVAAVVLAVWAVATRTATAPDVARATHLGFAIWVLAVGIVVEAAGAGFLGDLVDRLLPGHGTSYGALLLIAIIATVLANVLTNLPATLLLAPLLVPLGGTAILAALIGLNVGSGLTWTGSLANLLWRRTLTREGREISSADFHRISLVATPVAVLAAVTALWLTS